MFDSEKFSGLFAGVILDVINIVATGIETGMRIAFRIFVGEQVAHRELRRQRAIILAGDQLEIGPLVGQFLHDGAGERGRHFRRLGQIGEIGDGRRVDFLGWRLGQIVQQSGG